MEAKDNRTEQNDEKIAFSKKETCLSMEEKVKKRLTRKQNLKESVTGLSRDKMDLIGGEKSFS